MYLALYRKYRSATFDEVISQEHITTTLKNQIKTGTPAHAYLFTGSRGTGKTTCAKLMAKAVNCLSPVDGNPCGECECCKAIADGCPDIIEMDAASNNGVDDVRALRDEVMYAPTVCKYKVYIIDEVHMLSSQAFNALLKTIEEPPAHVIFILATTEVHKVPATIVSRCQQFRFSRIDIEASTARLREIAGKEDAKITEDAARLISRLSDGGMRDAVSLLDQCMSVSRDIDEETVRTTAGIAGTEHLFALADCIQAHNTAQALKILDELHNESKDLMLLLDELTTHFRNLCMLSSTNMDFSLIPAGSGSRNDLAHQTEKFTLGEIMRCLDILQDCIAKTPKTAKRKTVAEMCLIRLCTPRLDSDTTALSLRLEKLEKKLDELDTDKIVIQPRSTAPQPKSVPAAPDNTEQGITNNTAVQINNAQDIPQEEPPFDIDEPTTAEAPQDNGGKPDWLFEGTGNAETEQPPFDIDEPVSAEAPQNNGGKPDWLFEGTGNADTEQPPFDIDVPVSAEEPKDIAKAQEVPPFDLDEPPEPIRSEPPVINNDTPLAKAQQTEAVDPLVAEITDGLPYILQAVLKQVKVTLTETELVISNYQKFQYDFLTTGDSKERLEAQAQQVLGRKVVMTFDGKDKPHEEEKHDPVSDFLAKAEKAGVKIKYKQAKN